MRLILSALTCLIFLTGNALAAPALTKENRQHLETIIQDLLTRQKNAHSLSGGTLQTEGSLLIEEADGYYAVTLPAITVTDEQGHKADIGIIAVNSAPADKAGDWKLSVSMPSPITWTDQGGKPVGKLDIGSQRMSGIWNEELSAFTTLDATYEALRFEDLVQRTTYKAAQFTLASALKETGEDLWSGDTRGRLTGLSVATGADRNSTADEITFSMNIKDMSGAKQREMKEKLGALAENSSPEDFENMSPAGQLALYNIFSDIIRSAGNRMALSAAVKNLTVSMPAAASLPARTLKISGASLGYDMNGFDKGNAKLNLRGIYNNLTVTPKSGDGQDIVPSDLNLDIRLENLPFEELAGIGQEALKNASKSPAARQFAGIQAMMTLPQILSGAGTRLVIGDSRISSPLYSADVNGTMTADAASAMGAVGAVKAKISGLDNLIQTLQARAQKADPARKAKIEKTLQTLTVINLAGQAEQKDGKTVKSYDFQLTKEGKMLLNGSDLSLLTGVTGTPPAPAAGGAPKADTPKAR